ncbi:tetratricopeptide repeat protein [Amycolatopsis sp. RTGN1]|uniref:tetratricopeptide repeat protein n=1 Tax=Amycolatopsis ponsaeliensis TaxID=2992142 RepID=UPI00254AC306|nr:tetratricopeptide repeat protein [Amycolatopsis sp. RTGN1]
MSEPHTPGQAGFYGRQDEQRRLRGLLDDVLAAPRDETPSWAQVAVIHGLGGIGKSSLLNRLDDLLRGSQAVDSYRRHFTVVRVNWENERERYPAQYPVDVGPTLDTVLDALHTACDDAGVRRTLKSYRDFTVRRHEVLRKLQRRIAPAAAAEKDDRDSSKTAQLMEVLLQLGPTVGLPLVAAPDKVAKLLQVGADEARQLVDHILKRARGVLTTEEFALFIRPEQALVDAFADGLRAARSPLIVLLDTYEIVERVGPWLRRLMSRCGPRVAWVIAGRVGGEQPSLSGELAAFRREVKPGGRLRSLALGGFAEDDLVAYLSRLAPARPPTSDDLDELYRATHGIPLAVRTALALWRSGVPLNQITSELPIGHSHETLAQIMTEQFLRHLERSDPHEDRFRLLALALADSSADPELVGALWGIPDRQETVRALRGLAERHDFVFAASLRLHDVVRDVFRRYLLDPVRRADVAEANRRAITLLEERLVIRNSRHALLEDRIRDERWAGTVSALNWHRFWADTEAGWDTTLIAAPITLGYRDRLNDVLLEHAALFADTCTTEERDRLDTLRQGTVQQIVDLITRRPENGNPQPDDGCQDERTALIAVLSAEQAHNRPAVALDRYRHAKSLMPDDSQRLRELIGNGLWSLSKEVGWSTEKRAWIASEPALEAARLTTEVHPESALTWGRYGIILRAFGKNEDALGAFDHEAELEPDDPIPHQWRGLVLLDLRRAREALAAFDRALRIDPTYEMVHSWRADCLLWLGQHADAVRSYHRALALGDESARTYRGLGVVLQCLHRSAEALEMFSKAIDVDPFDESAYSSIAYVHGVAGQLDDALEWADRGLRRKPSSSLLLSRRGWLLAQQGQLDDAESTLLEVTAGGGDGTRRALLVLGAIAWHRGDVRSAEQLFTTLLSTPHSPRIYTPPVQESQQLAIAGLCIGRPKQAIEAFRAARSAEPTTELALGWLLDLLGRAPEPPPELAELRELSR